MNCQASRGFLTLSACDTPAATACSNCGRTMCPAHLSPASGFSTCYDCAATQRQQEEQGELDQTGEYDETWARGYRSSYYASSGYHPNSSYDRHDASSFDERQGDAFDEETERGFDAS